MKLVGTIIGENKKIAIFSAPNGGAYKYMENEAITDTTIILEIFTDVVIVQDEENNKSASIEEKNDEIDEENNISNLILNEKEKFEMLL